MKAHSVSLSSGAQITFLEELPATPDAAVEMHVRGHAVTLDPMRTAAYALVGVMPNMRDARPVLLRAGETLRVPGGFSSLWFFNANGWIAQECDVPSRSYGRIGLLISERPDMADMHMQALVAPSVPGLASVVKATGAAMAVAADPVLATTGNNLGWSAGVPIIPTSGVRRLRVCARPQHLLPTIAYFVSPLLVPEDFEATIRLWTLVVQGVPYGNVTTTLDPWVNPMITGVPGSLVPGSHSGVWIPHSGVDMAVTASEGVFDLDLMGSLAVALQLRSVSGTDTDGVNVNVEAF
jgi:hypothetical protein